MMKFIVFFLIVIAGLAGTVAAQETTVQPESPAFALQFPLEVPSETQLQEAFGCELAADSASSKTVEVTDTTACGLAKQALALARAREQNSDPSAEEIALLTQIASANPALLLDINLIAAYYNAAPLVAPPAFTDQPITSINLQYSFDGMGDSVDYTIKISQADSEPVVTGHVENSGGLGEATTPAATAEAVTLPDTIDVATIQAFAPALRDLLPTSTVFSMTPCWDYYPDWAVILTFADGTVATMVTQQSNVIGIGGPWQIEIEGRAYLQYSGAFAEAVTTLLDTMNLPLGTTAAMGCGDIDNPLHLAFPDFKAN
jgi:hypothetical protein